MDLLLCCFSPDGTFIAGGGNRNICIWDIASLDPRPTETLVGHSEHVTSLAWSSSLISSSHDKSIKLWKVGVLPTDRVVTYSDGVRRGTAQIKSVSLQANNGIAVSCDSAGVVRTWEVSTGLCKTSFRTPARGVEWGEAWLIDGRLIFCWCSAKDIYLWDTEKGELLQRVDVGSYFFPMGLRISADRSKVFLLDRKSLRAWSIRTGKLAGDVKLAGKPVFDSLVVDGSRDWVRFEDSGIQGGILGSQIHRPLSYPTRPCRLRPETVWSLSIARCPCTRGSHPGARIRLREKRSSD